LLSRLKHYHLDFGFGDLYLNGLFFNNINRHFFISGVINQGVHQYNYISNFQLSLNISFPYSFTYDTAVDMDMKISLYSQSNNANYDL